MEPVELAQEPKTKLRHGRTALRLLSFPVLLVYLELVLRLYMGLRPDYLPVVLPFALSGGSLLAGLTAVFPRRGNRDLIPPAGAAAVPGLRRGAAGQADLADLLPTDDFSHCGGQPPGGL